MSDDLTPQTNPMLYGHREAIATLTHDFHGGKPAHGLLLTGPQGIGKATLAYHYARMALAGQRTFDMQPDHPVFRRVSAGSHTDFLIVEPTYDSKKEEAAREITVEQARTVAQFLALTPGESQWRVVIIDAIDALNVNAANAILKILEEPPPQALLLLISHNPGRLLPTIRSRCRLLRLTPPDADDFAHIVRQHAPEVDAQTLRQLAQLSHHAPGAALALHRQQALALYAQILDLVANLPTLDAQKLHAFAEKYTGNGVHAQWQLLNLLLLHLFERVGKLAAGIGEGTLSEAEGRALHTLAALHPAPVWAAKWQECSEQFSLASRLHLDYKQVIIVFFHAIAGRDGFTLGHAA